jgi:hypothetical protein
MNELDGGVVGGFNECEYGGFLRDGKEGEERT